MRQFAEGEWPAGETDPIAVIAAEPDELTGVVWGEDVEEGLGEFRWAAVEAPGGVRLLLVRYRWNALPGTTVLAERHDDVHAAGLLALLAGFGLTADAITWRAPRPGPPTGADHSDDEWVQVALAPTWAAAKEAFAAWLAERGLSEADLTSGDIRSTLIRTTGPDERRMFVRRSAVD